MNLWTRGPCLPIVAAGEMALATVVAQSSAQDRVACGTGHALGHLAQPEVTDHLTLPSCLGDPSLRDQRFGPQGLIDEPVHDLTGEGRRLNPTASQESARIRVIKLDVPAEIIVIPR